jgi:hypothetical protein
MTELDHLFNEIIQHVVSSIRHSFCLVIGRHTWLARASRPR